MKIESFLQSARATHRVVLLASIATLVIGASPRENPERAVVALGTLHEAVTSGAYADYCAKVSIASLTESDQLRRAVARLRPAVGFAPDFGVRPLVYCESVRPDTSLQALRDFMFSEHRILRGTPSAAALDEVAKGVAELTGGYKSSDMRPQVDFVSVAMGGSIQRQGSAVVFAERPFDAGEPVVVTYQVSPGSAATSHHVGILKTTIGPLLVARRTGVDWLRADSVWSRKLVSPDGELSFVRVAAPYWEDISRMNAREARAYLRARAAEGKSEVEVLGIRFDRNVLGWIAPLLVLAVWLHLWLELDYLAGSDKSLPAFPWIALFPGRLPSVVAYVSTTVVPALGIAAGVRLSQEGWGRTALLVVCFLGTTPLSVGSWLSLRRLRLKTKCMPPAAVAQYGTSAASEREDGAAERPNGV